ncbi:MAG: glycosyltransferase family 2 protein [Erysipelotrichaceae bacterium]|nr:glycosyltransferase family 2 protein [Erysipelotrichaceae bacterium]
MNAETVKYSVIIPVYNVEKQLPRTIESVLDQTIESFELILVNDGSKDSSGSVCDLYAEKDKRVHVIHKENGGVSSARNAGIENAIGEYIVFIDSDDYVSPVFVKQFEGTDADLIIAGYVLETEDQEVLKRSDYGIHEYTVSSENNDVIKAHYTDGFYNYACTKAFRREIIRSNHLRFSQEITIGEDTLFVMDFLVHAKKVTVRDTCEYHYVRYNRQTLTHQKLNSQLIWQIENTNNLLYDSTKALFGNEAESITAKRISKLYRNFIFEITENEEIDADFLNDLFRQHWFRKVISQKDFMQDEDWKYRMIIRLKSAKLFMMYLNIQKWKKRFGKG